MTKTIPLSGKYAIGLHAVAIVSEEDFDDLAQFKWFAKAGGGKAAGHVYAMRTWREGGIKRFELMHRRVVGAQSGQEVDHINRLTCDNRRANLRVVTHRDNMLNKESLTIKLTCKWCHAETEYSTIAGSVKRKYCSALCRQSHDLSAAKARYQAKRRQG